MRLKDAIERALGTAVRIRAGAPGSLRVLVDGKQIYSLKDEGGMPRSEEIIRSIRGSG